MELIADQSFIPPSSPTQDSSGVKCCFKCKATKCEADFYLRGDSSTKRTSYCKQCVTEMSRERKKRLGDWLDRGNNRERMNEKRRMKYASNPDKFRKAAVDSYYRNRVRKLEQRRKNYAENREELAAKALESHKRNYATTRKWRAANKDRVAKYNREFSLRHPGHHIPHRHLRRARKVGAHGEKLARGYRERLMVVQKSICPYCSVDLKFVKSHLDHIIPLSRGGVHAERNLQWTCRACNQKKHNKHPLDFAAEMGIAKDPTIVSI